MCILHLSSSLIQYAGMPEWKIECGTVARVFVNSIWAIKIIKLCVQFVSSMPDSSQNHLKFVFVGITDNDNCRAARDVFCKEDISGHPKKYGALPAKANFSMLAGLGRAHLFTSGLESLCEA